MSEFIKEGNRVDAYQWFANGDHPDDKCEMIRPVDGESFFSEGKIVRYYRHPDHSGTQVCALCQKMLHVHGWIDEGEDGLNVCPGDYIVTRGREHVPIHPKEFEKSYEMVALRT